MKSYEAMFLMDPAMATDEAAAEAEIKRLLGRAEANVLGVKKWDERKLAYPIGPNKRGLYMLCFFEAAPEKIAPLERDAQLSEKTVRVIILRHDKLTPEAIEKAFNAPPPPKAPSRGDDWGGGRERFGGDRFGGDRFGGDRRDRGGEGEAATATAKSSDEDEDVPDLDSLDADDK